MFIHKGNCLRLIRETFPEEMEIYLRIILILNRGRRIISGMKGKVPQTERLRAGIN
jgi:hypothetical protein